jgi:hypothetical protein
MDAFTTATTACSQGAALLFIFIVWHKCATQV